MEILTALKTEEARLQHQLTAIRGAIAALNGASASTVVARKGGRSKRVVTAALRAHLSKKAKERWARVRAEKKSK